MLSFFPTAPVCDYNNKVMNFLRTLWGEEYITHSQTIPASQRPEHHYYESPFKLRVQSDVKNLAEIRRYVRASSESLQVDADVINEVVLAVDEAAANIILRGYQGQPGLIEIAVERQGDSLVIHLIDQAPVFDPTQVPPPDLTLPLEERPVGKMGVFLINQFIDDVIYSTPPQGGNHLILVKKFFYTENHEEESNDHND